MAKRKDKKRTAQLFSDLLTLSASEQPPDAHELARMGKFRFQLLHQWLVDNFAPCHVADIGGGKGLLAYLLRQSGWDATVIDPEPQPLPDKYKDLATRKRIRIPPTERAPHIDAAFEPSIASHFDLLVGLHAHGCNVKIIDAAVEYGTSFVLLPCCIIDEPVYPPRGVHWLQCLVDYAIERDCRVQPFRLNFSGQNIGFCGSGLHSFRKKNTMGNRFFSET